MTRLFTYCIPYDDGAAPNPYWGTCTLAICKPVIRRTARKGDWVVGTGSKKTLTGNDFSNCVIYAMKITEEPLSMAAYDAWTQKHLPEKIPDLTSKDLLRRVGDSIYDFSKAPPMQRKGVHSVDNMPRDLRGENVLLSRNFYYFGNKPERLPSELSVIVRQGQGHRVGANQSYVTKFLKWVKTQGFKKNCIVGEPDLLHLVAKELTMCAASRCQSDDDDEQMTRPGEGLDI